MWAGMKFDRNKNITVSNMNEHSKNNVMLASTGHKSNWERIQVEECQASFPMQAWALQRVLFIPVGQFS